MLFSLRCGVSNTSLNQILNGPIDSSGGKTTLDDIVRQGVQTYLNIKHGLAKLHLIRLDRS